VGVRSQVESAVGRTIVLDGQQYLNFAGSAYLGSAFRDVATEAARAALRSFGAGPSLSPSSDFASPSHLEVERQAARFFGTETAVFLSAGYLFGATAIGASASPDSAFFYDELSHHCLVEAIRSTGQPNRPYRHLDVADLAHKLRRHLQRGQRPIIATDSLFSTFGSIAPLGEILEVAGNFDGAQLVIDDSHAMGVLGTSGRGARELMALPEFACAGGSLGKAFSACGGIIPCSRAQARALRQTAVSRGAAAGPAAAAAACAASLRYVETHPELLAKLRQNTLYLKTRAAALGLPVNGELSPVFGIAHPQAAGLRSRLMRLGIHAYHSRYLGAGRGGVLRFAIFADHETRDLDRLIAALERVL
jgi:7-keto-8-aminopelargonate synthetase-like enzyme